MSLSFLQVVCVGSIEELHQLSGVKIEDLHREKCVNAMYTYLHFHIHVHVHCAVALCACPAGSLYSARLFVGASACSTVRAELRHYTMHAHHVGSQRSLHIARICWFVNLLSEVGREKMPCSIVETRGTALLT